MLDIAFYKVPYKIAQRAGVANFRYRTIDGMFIVDNKDLQRVRMTSEEMLTGLQGVIKISKDEVLKLKVENKYLIGFDGLTDGQKSKIQTEPAITETTNVQVIETPEIIEHEETVMGEIQDELINEPVQITETVDGTINTHSEEEETEVGDEPTDDTEVQDEEEK